MRGRWAAWLAVTLVLVAACSPATEAGTAPAPSTPAPAATTPSAGASGSSPTTTTFPLPDNVSVTRDVAFTDALAIDVFAPIDAGSWPTIVFFHGGSWYGGAKERVEPFAATMAAAGAVVFNATYRTGQEGGGYPQSYEDVRCAVLAATALAEEYGGDDRLIVAGHSAGAHLAATVVLSGAFDSETCRYRGDLDVDGFAGLAGPYDSDSLGLFLIGWFGGTLDEVPDRWTAGNPYTYAGEAPPLDVLLVHGTADRIVDPASSNAFGALLEDGGIAIRSLSIDGGEHNEIIDPNMDGTEVAAAIVEFAAG